MNIIEISSVNKAINKAKITGVLDLKIIYLYSILFDLTKIFPDNYKELSGIMLDLKNKYHNILCNYKYNSKELIPKYEGLIAVGFSKNILREDSYKFKVSDFNENMKFITLYPNKLNGKLFYFGREVPNIITLSLIQVNDLVYIRESSNSFQNDIINFKYSNDITKDKDSNIASIFISGTDNSNQPATIGDNTIETLFNVTIPLTLEMFTTDLKAPYNDPEGDLIDAIQIIEMPKTNKGIFTFDNEVLDLNTIITREDLINERLKYTSPENGSFISDTFRFKARDEGSKIWVE